MKNCHLIADASIQNHRASRGTRGANSHKDPTWRSQHTHELCAKTSNLLSAGARFKINNDARFFGSSQRLRAVVAKYGAKTVFVLC